MSASWSRWFLGRARPTALTLGATSRCKDPPLGRARDGRKRASFQGPCWARSGCRPRARSAFALTRAPRQEGCAVPPRRYTISMRIAYDELVPDGEEVACVGLAPSLHDA